LSIQVSNYYDQFSVEQKKTGVNLRHYTILYRLKKLGLRKDSNVLEIGCGIGTLTGLLASYVSDGKLIAADISPESISIAKQRTSRFKNIEFLVTDMSTFNSDQVFDFIVFPDVLEHIPLEQHEAIFKLLVKNLAKDSRIVIHIPDPINLNYVREKFPEALQIIDQSIFISDFLNSTAGTPLQLDIYERYCLFANKPDYNWIVFSVKQDYSEISKQSKIKLKILEWYRRIFSL
jgi:trans-aconitate 2-methyltransferase